MQLLQILNDILKVTSLNENTIKEILINTNFNETILEEDLSTIYVF